MTDPADRDDQNDRPAPLLSRLVRSVFAPDVLEDGGRDAPLTRNGTIIFRTVVAALVMGIVVLLLVTASSR